MRRTERRTRGSRPAGVAACAALAALAAGCGGESPQSVWRPAGPQAERLHELWLVMLAVGAAVFVVVMALVAVAVLRRQTPEGGPPPEQDPRRARAVLAGAVTTVAILTGLLVHSVLVSRTLTTAPDDPLRIEVVAQQWWWDVTYRGPGPADAVRTANELHVPVGRPVEITLTSRDVIHSFWVPALHGKLDAVPGRQNRLWLQADAPGVHRGQCAEFCGLQHALMAFLVIAEPPEEFERWVEGQRRPAAEPKDELAARGREVFLGSTCAACHTIRGTGASASAGPDLTHLASRRTLAAGTLPNARGPLGGWILDPQHAKPGTFMPATALAADDLDALLQYLGSLE